MAETCLFQKHASMNGQNVPRTVNGHMPRQRLYRESVELSVDVVNAVPAVPGTLCLVPKWKFLLFYQGQNSGRCIPPLVENVPVI